MALNIVAWNIGQGGGHDIDAIAGTLDALKADITFISEFRTGINGMVLRAGLDRMGLVYQTPCATDPHQDAIIIASRIPFVQCPDQALAKAHRHRFVHVLLGKYHLAGACFPDMIPGDPVFDHMVAMAAKVSLERAIFIGSGHPGKDTDPQNPQSPESGHIESLNGCGLIDAWPLANKSRLDYSWFTPDGRGYRMDYALVSPRLAHCVIGCEYDHDPRMRQITTHSILVLNLDAKSA